MLGNNFLLWEDNDFIIKTPFNPHIPYSEGPHLVVMPKKQISNAWESPDISAETFKLATKVCRTIEELNISPWFNLQANGNWGLLEEDGTFFHIHIYGRNRTSNWGKPVQLPEAKNTYTNEPMPEADRDRLVESLKKLS